MASYKEVYEKEFIIRTQEIIRDYMKRGGPYKLTLLLNCLIGLVILPDQRTRADRPPAWNAELGTIPFFSDARIVPTWRGSRRLDLATFLRKLRNGVAHQNIEPINKGNGFVGVKIWNRARGGQNDFEVELRRQQLERLGTFIAEEYLAHLSKRDRQAVVQKREE